MVQKNFGNSVETHQMKSDYGQNSLRCTKTKLIKIFGIE